MLMRKKEKLSCWTTYCGLLKYFEYCETDRCFLFVCCLFLTRILGHIQLEQNNYCNRQTTNHIYHKYQTKRMITYESHEYTLLMERVIITFLGILPKVQCGSWEQCAKKLYMHQLTTLTLILCGRFPDYLYFIDKKVDSHNELSRSSLS